MVAKSDMVRIARWAGFAATLVCQQTATAVADNEAAEVAYDRGDYDSAMVQWLAEADRGDATAQYNVATLLRLGRGGARQIPRPRRSGTAPPPSKAIWRRRPISGGCISPAPASSATRRGR